MLIFFVYFIIHWYVQPLAWVFFSGWGWVVCALQNFPTLNCSKRDFANTIRNRLFFIDFSCCFLFHTFFLLPFLFVVCFSSPFKLYIFCVKAECWWYILYILYSTMNDHWIFFHRFFALLSHPTWFFGRFCDSLLHILDCSAAQSSRPAVQLSLFEIRETPHKTTPMRVRWRDFIKNINFTFSTSNFFYLFHCSTFGQAGRSAAVE